MASIEAQLKTKQEELNALQATYDEFMESSKEVENEMELALKAADDKAADLSRKAIQFEKQQLQLQEKCSQLSKENSNLLAESSRLKANLQSSDETKRSLESSSEEMSTKIRILESTEQDLRHKVETCEEDIYFLQTDLDELKASKLDSETRLKRELTELQAELAGKPRNNDTQIDGQECMVTSEDANSDHLELIGALEQENEQLTARLSEAEQQNQELNDEISRIADELIELQTGQQKPVDSSVEIEALKLSLVEAELKWNAFENSQTLSYSRDIEDLEMANENLANEVNRLATQLADSEQQNEEMSNELSRVTDELIDVQTKSKKSMDEVVCTNEALRAQVERLSVAMAELGDTSSQSECLNKEIESLKSKLGAADEEKKSLLADLKRMVGDLAKMQANIASHDMISGDLTGQVSTLQELLDESQQEISSLNQRLCDSDRHHVITRQEALDKLSSSHTIEVAVLSQQLSVSQSQSQSQLDSITNLQAELSRLSEANAQSNEKCDLIAVKLQQSLREHDIYQSKCESEMSVTLAAVHALEQEKADSAQNRAVENQVLLNQMSDSEVRRGVIEKELAETAASLAALQDSTAATASDLEAQIHSLQQILAEINEDYAKSQVACLQFQEQIALARSESVAHAEALSLQSAELATAQDSLQLLKSELGETRTELISAQESLEEHKSEVYQLTSELEQVNDDYNSKHLEHVSVNQELMEAKAELHEEMERLAAQHQRTVDAAAQRLVQMETHNNTLAAELTRVTDDHMDAQGKQQSSSATCSQLSQQVMELQHELHEARSALSSATESTQQMVIKNESALTGLHRDYSARIDVLNEEVKNLQQSLTDLRKVLDSKDLETERTQQLHENALMTLQEEHSAHLQSLKDEIGTLQQSLANMNTILDAKVSETASTQQLLAQYESALTSLKKEHSASAAALNEEIKQLQQALGDMTKSFNAKVSEAQSDSADYESRLEAKTDLVAALETQLSHHIEKHSQATAGCEQLQYQLDELQAKYDKFVECTAQSESDTVSQLKSTVEVLKADVRLGQAEVGNTQSKLNDSITTNEVATQKIAQLIRDVEAANAKILELGTVLDQKESDHECSDQKHAQEMNVLSQDRATLSVKLVELEESVARELLGMKSSLSSQDEAHAADVKKFEVVIKDLQDSLESASANASNEVNILQQEHDRIVQQFTAKLSEAVEQAEELHEELTRSSDELIALQQNHNETQRLFRDESDSHQQTCCKLLLAEKAANEIKTFLKETGEASSQDKIEALTREVTDQAEELQLSNEQLQEQNEIIEQLQQTITDLSNSSQSSESNDTKQHTGRDEDLLAHISSLTAELDAMKTCAFNLHHSYDESAPVLLSPSKLSGSRHALVSVRASKGVHDNYEALFFEPPTSASLAISKAIESANPGKMEEELNKQMTRFDAMRIQNAKLLQKLQALKGNIQVCCRCRPPNDQELVSGGKLCVETVDDNELICYDKRAEMWKSFVFDKVWPLDSTQADVFSDIEPLVLSVIDGYNSCIFAYGQTGSGKTFTMNGYGQDFGVSYRTLHKIFEMLELRKSKADEARVKVKKARGRVSISPAAAAAGCAVAPKRLRLTSDDGDTAGEEDADAVDEDADNDEATNFANLLDASFEGDDVAPTFSYTVQVSMMEIYNEQVNDLLNPNVANRPLGGLDIRQAADGTVCVPDLQFVSVRGLSDVMQVFARGSANRATGATNLNEHSSRSHSILLVDVTTTVENSAPIKGKLYVVDLAGSERVGKSGATGAALKEAQHINKSLSALGDVMEALDQKNKHVPYRNSKLTYLLQDSLGGNSRTMMVVTVCPTESNGDESLFALQFATRVRNINIGTARRNVTTKNMEEGLKLLKNELKVSKKKRMQLEDQLLEAKRDQKKAADKLSSQLDSKSRNVEELKRQSEIQVAQLYKSNHEMVLKLQEEKDGRHQLLQDLDAAQKQQKKFHDAMKEMNREKEKLTALVQMRDKAIEVMKEQSSRQSAGGLGGMPAPSVGVPTRDKHAKDKDKEKDSIGGGSSRLPLRIRTSASSSSGVATTIAEAHTVDSEVIENSVDTAQAVARIGMCDNGPVIGDISLDSSHEIYDLPAKKARPSRLDVDSPVPSARPPSLLVSRIPALSRSPKLESSFTADASEAEEEVRSYSSAAVSTGGKPVVSKMIKVASSAIPAPSSRSTSSRSILRQFKPSLPAAATSSGASLSSSSSASSVVRPTAVTRSYSERMPKNLEVVVPRPSTGSTASSEAAASTPSGMLQTKSGIPTRSQEALQQHRERMEKRREQRSNEKL